MLTDNEIRRIKEDSLQFTAFAHTLKEIITTSGTPITIGVYGAWGSGKTSLMRMTQDLLEKEYLFSWDNVPGNDNERLLRFLMDDLAIGWAENAEIRKSDDGKTIRIFKDENSAEIMIDERKEKATLKISDGRTHDLKVKKENGKLNIYEKEDRIKTVWFDAWKFDKTYDLRVALIYAILRRMKEDESATEEFKDRAVKLLKRVNWVGLGKAALSYLSLPISQGKEPLLKNQEEIPEETLELIGDFEKEFKQLTKEYVGAEGRMVVFIDDLDRCIPEKTIDILEAIKLFLNVPGSVFVIGADRKRIVEGIILKFKGISDDWAENYLEKIVQIPFTLPPLRKDVITKQFIPRLNISMEMRKYADILAEVGDNPRKIKRLLNSFELQRILAEKRELEVKEDIIAKLAVIDFKWYDFYTDLVSIYSETGTNLAKSLKETSESNKAEREKRLKEWEILRKYFEDKRLMYFLKEEPLLWDVDLEQYVYLARSTTELKEGAVNYFNIAYSFGEKGDYDKAIEYYDKAIGENPNYVEAWFNKGVVLGKLKRHGEAIECYDKAIKLNRDFEEAWLNKGVVLGKLEGYAEAIKCYDKAIELNPNDVEAWFNKGVVLGKLERHEEAMECYDKVIELNPNDEKAWYGKGFRLGLEGRHKEAIECYDEATKLNPNFEEAWLNKGIELDKLERHEDDAEAWFIKGVEFSKLKRHKEAIECYDEAIKLNPNYVEAWFNKGDEFSKLKRREEAIECYDKAIKLNPNYVEAWLNKGIELAELAEYEATISGGSFEFGDFKQSGEAIECYDKAIELNPNYAMAWRYKGQALKKLGRRHEAEHCFQKAKELGY